MFGGIDLNTGDFFHGNRPQTQRRYAYASYPEEDLDGQGRRHGFESGGGDNFASGANKNFFLDPPLFGQWGDKTLLRWLSKPNSFV